MREPRCRPQKPLDGRDARALILWTVQSLLDRAVEKKFE